MVAVVKWLTRRIVAPLRVGSTPTICAISAVESKDFTADIFVYGFEM